ncbi:SusC/RagA family TonB-linked outer membrane protein [Sphingobacterium spiritivorum]|nr:SusC/RagA family TonB-linked outer membrane protein [Sphingobacterium spiritivorum]
MIFFNIEKSNIYLFQNSIKTKAFLIMKLSLLLLLSFMTLSFSRGYSQNISLNLKNVRLEDAFERIEKQSEYTFVYEKNALRDAKKLNIFLNGKPVKEALQILLKNQPLDYKIHQKYIIISQKKDKTPEAEAIKPSVTIQARLSGVIVDSLGQAISGVSILNNTNQKRTSTDQSGAFNLEGKPGDVLTITYIGYHTQRHEAKSASAIRIVLMAQEQEIETVVITALGIKRSEKTLSYQVQKVGNEDLTTVKNSNFVNSLVGKVAGAQINSSSAGPGGAVKVVMRGNKSISLNNNVLYVIDGVPMNNFISSGGDGQMTAQPGTESIADINPDDIENISVMTGPSAAALYGFEGANGVILITTKKGSADKTTLSLSHSTTFSDPLLLPKFQNTYGNVAGSVMSWGEETQMRYDPSNFFNTGSNVNNVVALSTGNEKSQNYFSAGANNAHGIMPNNKYNRYNFLYRNTTTFLDNKLVLDASVNYIIQNNSNMVAQGQYFNPLPALYLFPRNEDFSNVQLFERFDPVTEVNKQYWIYGDQGLSIQNPYWTMYRMNRNADRKRYMLTSSLKYNFSNDLNITGRVNVDNMNLQSTDNRYASTLGALAGPKGRHNLTTREERQLYADLIATYTKNFDPFNININAGASIKDKRMNAYTIEGDLQQIINYFSIENMNRAVGTFKTDQDGLKRQTQSVFANAEIGYKNFLFLTLTGRNDWDSALAWSQSPERSFFYPSVGLSTVLSEAFTLPNWFSYLKARGSYTKVGNSYDPYLTTEQYIYDAQTNTYALAKIRPNFFLKPELTTSYEFGLDMKFLKNSLSLSATYYSSDTENQTHTILESGTEYTGRIIQTGNVRNSGIELLLGYQNTWDKFAWSSNLTFSFNKNKIVSLYGADILRDNPTLENYVDKATLGSIGSPVVRLREGGSMGDIYSTSDFKRDNNGYIYLNPSTLLPSMETLNTNDYRKLGSLLPKSHMGWKNSFTYKDLRLNVVLSGRFGGLVVSNTQAILDRYGVSEYSANLRRQGNINILGHEVSAQDYMNVVAEGTGKSDLYVYKADNVRLQELSIEYTINKRFLGNIANATIGIVGNNLALLYNRAPFDPESVPSASSTYYTGVDFFMQPSLRNIGFNLKLQF